jgi:hypothetical protein
VLQTNGSGVLSFSTPSAGAFTFLGETSASNVATVDLNGYFTSSYDYYQIYLDDMYSATNAQDLHMKFSTTGSYTVQTSQYYNGHTVLQQDSSSSQSFSHYAIWNEAYAQIVPSMSSTSTQVSSAIVTILNPMGSNVKTFHYSYSSVFSNIGIWKAGSGGGRWNSTTAITGVRFNAQSGNMYARKIRIYGIKNS